MADVAKQYRERATVTYSEDITTQEPGRAKKYLGKRVMQCDVELTLQLADAISYLGARAGRSKGGKAKDGPVSVKRIGVPVELSREMRHVEANS